MYCQGFKTIFNKNIIYIKKKKKIGSVGSFESPDYNVEPPLKKAHIDLHIVYIDLEKVYGRVPREVMKWVLERN